MPSLLKRMICYSLVCIAGVALSTASVASTEAALFAATLVESDAEDCLAHGGKLVSVQRNVDTPSDVEVWIDRWFMQVQTADHTRHVLNSKTPEVALGCTRSLAGPQHWTIFSTRLLQPSTPE